MQVLRVDKDNFYLHFEAIAFIGEDKAYAASMLFNGLFEVDMISGKCKYVDMFPDERRNGRRLYFAAECCKGKIVFAPMTAERIAVYDTVTGTFEMLEFMDSDNEQYRRGNKFSNVLVHDNKVFLIGATYPYIIKLDVATYNLEYIPINITDCFNFRKGILVGEVYYVSSFNSNYILEFDMRSEQVAVYNLPCDFKGSWNMCYDGNAFWLDSQRSDMALVCWEKKNNAVSMISEFPEGFQAFSGNTWHRLIFSNGFIWAIPTKANMIIKIDVGTQTVTCGQKVQASDGEQTIYYFDYNNQVYLLQKDMKNPLICQADEEFMKFDILTSQFISYGFKLTEGYEKLKCDYMKRMTQCFREQKALSLHDYLSYIEKL